MQRFGWSRVAILQQAEEVFISVRMNNLSHFFKFLIIFFIKNIFRLLKI